MWLLAVLAVIAAVAYWFSLWRRPYRNCWRCHGSKSNADTALFRGAKGRCWICGGSGKRIRWGVILFMRGTYHAIKSGKEGRFY